MDRGPPGGSAIRALRPRPRQRQPQDLQPGGDPWRICRHRACRPLREVLCHPDHPLLLAGRVAFSIWFLTLGGILLYNLRWDQFRLRKGLHIAIGYATAATEHIFLFIIVALDSHLLTPGQGQGTAAFFNPSYWPELGHRFAGNLSWASFFIAAVAAIYAAASRIPANRLYFHWAARTSLVVGFT